MPVWKRVCVYMVQVKGGGPIKIGVAKRQNLRVRLRNLQHACPYEIRLLCVLPDVPTNVEGYLHGQFSDSRLHGEWFKPTPELKALATSLERNKIPEDLREFIFAVERNEAEMTWLV